MTDSKSLTGKLALVTGASRGIGAATAQALAAAGAHVILVARTAAALEEVEDRIHAAGGSATIAPLDLTDGESIGKLAGAVAERWEKLDVLILNVDAENKRISLGLKQAQEDPWLRIGETYPVGTELRGRVMRLMDKGVVVDLGSDIEGFVPMSQLGIPDIQQPGDAVKEGQAVELKVLEVDPIHHRIVLAATGFPKEDGTPTPQPVGNETPRLDA